MPSHFVTLGPFELGNTSKPLGTAELKIFWSHIAQEFEGLDAATGVYVLGLGSGIAMTPVYVGKAERGFRKRLKPNHDAFRRLRDRYPDTTLSIFFVARVTNKTMEYIRARQKGEQQRSINELEILLIRECLASNHELVNSSGVKFYRELVVPGFLHDKDLSRTQGAANFRRMLKAKIKNKQAKSNAPTFVK